MIFNFRSLNCSENANDAVVVVVEVVYIFLCVQKIHQSGKYHLTDAKCPEEKPQLFE